MKDKNFSEVIDISPNHTLVVGTIRKGKTTDIFKQLLDEKEDDEIPKPIIGDRVIPYSSFHEIEQDDKTKRKVTEIVKQNCNTKITLLIKE
ncbi:hypothetical protein [Rodentibacter caecimuris]|uniref:Uncharacterized protein n=1 Tax=Rodentibacter caecimuris TaxID=1796644 RepID=A0AAJ3N084_9PAST|nr:hypothetical protein [Rodentibacter heylii]OOF70554.1 hypothetical protein BKG90_09690 [Rodentibacter heylii]OOF72078.1 hypothetical protein BKG99_12140 [Rodentibacter heylii]